MASSPIYRATPELPRYRSSYSVPAQSRDINRGDTPGSSRGSKSFFNRLIPSSSSRSQSVARDDPASLANHMQRVASAGKVLESWNEVERKYKDTWLEDDDEVDLMTETVHKSDGSTAQWLPDRGQGLPDWAKDEDDSIQAGPSRRRITSRRPEDADDDTDSNEDSHDDVEDAEPDASEEDDDELGSWRDQEDDLKAQLAHRKAALLLASLRNRPEQTSDEEMAEFLRDEETARARRMSARAEGRDSRCHTDAFSESVKSDSDGSRSEYRSPSKFSTIITDTVEDLFSDDESGEDELALPSSDVEFSKGHQGSEDSEEEETLQTQSELILARARQVRSTWPVAEPSQRRMTVALSPDSSPEPEIVAEYMPSLSKISASRYLKQRPTKLSKPPPDIAANAPPVSKVTRSDTIPETRVKSPAIAIVEPKKSDKGKGRMLGERPTDPAILDDVFGPGEFNPHSLDRRRYRRSRYRQKASDNFKTCRYCRNADPARARLAEYCRGANHSKLCTFEYPPDDKEDRGNTDTQTEPAATATATKYWKSQHKNQSLKAASSETRLSALNPNGLEKWRYFDKVIKKPDKQTDRSCPYCRVSSSAIRRENAVFCRGRIESKDCTFDGHKGSLRTSSKGKRKDKVDIITAQRPVSTEATPKTPSYALSGPDLTVDERHLDLRLYYASLIRDQLQSGYRFCADCARSGDPERRRMSYWCRGRISYKACGHWDGDETLHRRKSRQSGSGSKIIADGQNASSSRADGPSASAPSAGVTERVVDSSLGNSSRPIHEKPKQPRPKNVVASLYYPEAHELPSGSLMHCLSCRSADAERSKMSAYCRGRTSPTRCPFNVSIDENGLSGETTISRKRGRPRKSEGSISAFSNAPKRALAPSHTTPSQRPSNPIVISEQRPTSEPIKRKPGRPRKTPLNEPHSMPSDSKSLDTVTQKVLSHSISRSPNDKQITHKRPRPRKSGPETASIQKATSEGSLMSRKPSSISAAPSGKVEFVRAPQTIAMPKISPKALPRSERRDPPSPSRRMPRRQRSRTFDIVVPASRSSPSRSLTPDIAVSGDRYFAPVSDMRDDHTSYHIAPHRLDEDVGMRELNSLPPSSPPVSMSPSVSPQPIRFMPSGHRSSPLASVRRQDRSSISIGSTPIRGILRQSSEVSEGPRKRARVSFSLIRSPSPDNESSDTDYDSESSDDVLLLVEPSSSTRRSAPPSSQRKGSSSSFAPETRFAESPQAGRLSSSTLAEYARPLDRSPLSHIGHSAATHTLPSTSHYHTGRRSPLSTPPITSRSVPPSSSRGLMLPPPVPTYRLAPIPQTEPRSDKRARTAGPPSRPRSHSMISKPDAGRAPKKLVAENLVIRRLIDDGR